jgi:LysM repeat protein
MSRRREVLTGIFAALISIIIIGGSFAAASTEVRSSVSTNMTSTPTLTSFPTHIILVTQRPGEPTYTPSPTLEVPSSPTPTSATIACPPPAGWSAIVVQPGDTPESLAQIYNISSETLKEANCLVGSSLASGTIFYVPGTPPPTDIPCGPPSGWVYYIVKKGDTLYSIGRAYSVSPAQLQAANCMGSSTTIRIGQKLQVPNVTPIMPSSTPTLTNTPAPELTATPTLIPPSTTPTVILPSLSPTPILATITPPLPTETPIIPTDTPISPTLTFTPTSTPVTITLVPTDIPTSTTPSTSTPYPTPTETFTPEPTLTPTDTSTP